MEKSKIKKILAVRTDRFGEFLLNIPAIRALKETFSQAKLILAVNATVLELAKMLDCVDNTLTWEEVRQNLKKYRFDMCVALNPVKEVHLKSFLAGIPVRVGYSRKFGFLLTHRMKDTKEIGNRHEVDCNLELVNLVGAVTQNKSLSIRLDEPLPEFIRENTIAIHPFTSDPVKQWPFERFEDLARRISDETKAKVVFVGRSEEWGQSPFGNSPHSGNVINMINKTNLSELAALLKRCTLLVSGDSGPVHLSSAVGTPVIALFRNDLPGKTARRWGPWGKGHFVIEKKNFNDISVDEVFDKIKEIF